MTVEVPRHKPLAQQFDTMHLRFDAAPAVVSAPSSPKGPAEVFGGPQGLVSRGGTSGDGLPWLRIFAGWDDGMGAAIRNCIMALARVVGAVCRDAANLLVLRDLAEQIG